MGVPLRNGLEHAKYYTQVKSNGVFKWRVCRIFNNKMYYFGLYNTEEEAKSRVKELHENNWGGLL